MVDDPQQFREGLDRQRRLLRESDTVHDDDRDAIQRYLRRKDGSIAVSSMKTYLRRLRKGSERSETPLIELDEDGYHELVFTLRHDHDLADSTVKSYENAILPFLETMADREWAEDVERTAVDRQSITEGELLTPKDIQQLTTAARHERDVAFIEFLADTGVRLSLALSLRVGDLGLEGERATYTPNADALGLKGAAIQPYPLIDSLSPIRSYLRTSHPRPDDPNVALFHKLQPSTTDREQRWADDGGMRANAMTQHLKRLADRADVDKPVRPHAFRHAAITRMVREGYSRSQIEHRVHWTLDSSMWETYEHVTSAEHNDDIFAEAGVVDRDDGPAKVRKRCGNCTEPLAPHHDFCANCGQPVSPGAEETVDEAKESVLETLVEATNPATRREIKTALAELEANPDLAAAAAADDHDDSS